MDVGVQHTGTTDDRPSMVSKYYGVAGMMCHVRPSITSLVSSNIKNFRDLFLIGFLIFRFCWLVDLMERKEIESGEDIDST